MGERTQDEGVRTVGRDVGCALCATCMVKHGSAAGGSVPPPVRGSGSMIFDHVREASPASWSVPGV